MKFVSWNVNGLRACLKKGFVESVLALDADFICLQETKMEQGQAEVELPGYHEFWNSADKKGYSGTAIFTRHEPISAACGMDLDRHGHEGRLITLEYPEFWLVNCYTPNAQRELVRIGYRMEWEDDLLDYLKSLDKTKPVIYCGDLNVAHEEIDLKNPKTNRGNAGFSDQERGAMTRLLGSGFADTFRLLYPDQEGAYSWWSYRFGAREKNVGWRIDYFIVSDRLGERVEEASIHPEVQGSDHCPVSLILK
ncbi:MAG: exodeoxyribonuclease III [Clostridiales bacterium]|nr:exodeoxyribonuclease III [Clostridiales bacterium]